MGILEQSRQHQTHSLVFLLTQLKVMEKLFSVTVLLAVPRTFGQRDVSPCGLPEELGPCRYTEPCKPKLFAWNDTFIIVSWEGLFQGCHEDQINGMYIKRSEGKHMYIYDNINFSENKSYLERKYCDNSKIALRIDFNEDHTNAPNVQQRDLHTHYNDCVILLILIILLHLPCEVTEKKEVPVYSKSG